MVVAFAVSTTPVAGAEITVIASNAVKEALLQLIPEFQRRTGHQVDVAWGGTTDIIRRVLDGNPCDLVAIPDAGIDDLIRQGRLREGGRVDFVRSGIGVAAASNSVRPNVDSRPALRQTLLSARSIVLSSGPSSVYLLKLFEEMGISEDIKSRIRRLPVGESVGQALARGEGEIGFTQISELLEIKGIEYVGPLPADTQHYTVFSFGTSVGARDPAAVRSFVNFLKSPAAEPAIRHAGQEPA